MIVPKVKAITTEAKIPLDYRICLFNKGNQVVQQIFFKNGEAFHFIRSHDIARSAVIFYGSSVAARYGRWYSSPSTTSG